jgi:hypothetical protein
MADALLDAPQRTYVAADGWRSGRRRSSPGAAPEDDPDGVAAGADR